MGEPTHSQELVFLIAALMFTSGLFFRAGVWDPILVPAIKAVLRKVTLLLIDILFVVTEKEEE